MSGQNPTISQVYDFLKRHYRHSRFEGRGKDVAQRIASDRHDDLIKTGWTVISRHESYNNQIVKFDHRLIDMNADVPPIEYAPQDSHLSHLLD